MSVKKFWMRLGVSMELTGEEFAAVRNEGPEGESVIRRKVESGDFYIDGNTYAPENTTRPNNGEWVFDADIEFDFCPRSERKMDDAHGEWLGCVRWHIEDIIAAAAGQGVSFTDEAAAAWWRNNETAFKICWWNTGIRYSPKWTTAQRRSDKM